MSLKQKRGGFTLLELLVVIAIMGILAVVVLTALQDGREAGRDGGRKAQVQEYFKALELYHSDHGNYPPHIAPDYELEPIVVNPLIDQGYMSHTPNFIGDFRYCTSGGSFMIAVDTERDKNGSDLCHILRGPGGAGVNPYGCDYTDDAVGVNHIVADTSCIDRF